MGLDIGAVMPEELAVSILAEIIAVRHGKSGGSLQLSGDDLLQQIQDVPEPKKPALPF